MGKRDFIIKLRMKINTIIQGDCLEVLKTFPDNCIDTIITDPPYGIGFMGKEWDNFKPEYIDGKMGKDNKRPLTRIARTQRSNAAGTYDLSPRGLIIFQKWVESWAKECLRVAKPGATLLCFGGSRTWHRLSCAIEDAGWVIKDTIMWIYGSGFPKATDISNQLDKMAGKEREIIGENPNKVGRKHNAKGEFAGSENNPKSTDEKVYITKPTTPEAKIWNGWKSHGLKPAYEPIIMAMKPNKGSYAENALKYGVAGLNIDGGRIGIEIIKSRGGRKSVVSGDTRTGKALGMNAPHEPLNTEHQGRFPANLILDEETAQLLDKQSGISKTKPNMNYRWNKQSCNGNTFKGRGTYTPREDIGGASRFFYVAKVSRAERNMGCERLENHNPCYESHRPNYRNTKGIETPYAGTGRTGNNLKNNHPTVKPLKLMEYLCLLTKTPTGGIVLDPFAGSGTTGMACKKLKRNYILIEKEEEYCKIAEARIRAIPETLF